MNDAPPPTSFEKSLKIFQQITTLPNFVTVESDPEFVEFYCKPEAIKQRMIAYGEITAYREYKRQKPFMSLINALILHKSDKTKEKVAAEAGAALFAAASSGKMGGVQDLVNAFQIKRGESEAPHDRQIKALDYFQKLNAGEPFESGTLKSHILKEFIQFCDEYSILPSEEELWKLIPPSKAEGYKGRFTEGLEDLGLKPSSLP